MRRIRGEAEVRLEAVVQPAADIVARRAAAMNDLVVASTAAHVARPALRAGFLPMHVPFGEPARAPARVHAALERAHRSFGVADESVTGGQVAVGRDTEVARTG